MVALAVLIAGCHGLSVPVVEAPTLAGQSTPGYGAPVVKDARITVHFTATTQAGETVADTERRGMAFTFLMDQDTVEPFWHDAVRNMRAGGTRTVTLPASRAGLAVEGDPPLTVTVKVVKVAPL